MTLRELLDDLERRAGDAERLHATALVSVVLRQVAAELAPLATGNGNPSPVPPARPDCVLTPSPPMDDRLMTVRVAAGRLGVTERWLYRHARDFPFTVRLPGGGLRFRAVGIDTWLARRTAAR